jgi:hypothetical protein
MPSRDALAAPSAEDNQIIDAMRQARATSPSRACPSRDLRVPPSARFDELVHIGIIREAAPGTFYLYEPALSAGVPDARRTAAGTRARLLRTLAFWLFVIIIPVLFLQFSK